MALLHQGHLLDLLVLDPRLDLRLAPQVLALLLDLILLMLDNLALLLDLISFPLNLFCFHMKAA